MKGYAVNIENLTLNNTAFRKVIYTAKNTQLVLMSLKPGEEIGNEIHDTVDQFIRIEKGAVKVILNNGETEYSLTAGFAVVIPSGNWHNVVNTGTEEVKLYTLYSPPEHKDQVMVQNKEEAVEEHFDGKTTE